MASNLDYLNPALLPLEDKVKAYLEAEEDLRKAIIEARNLQVPDPAAMEAELSALQRPATGSFDQPIDEVQQRLQNMHDDLAYLRQEIIGMVPTRNEWVKVNLGYGPSRVGVFSAPAPDTAEPHYELRIVH
ncbi:hypothetical protein LJY25_02115 [Hymenobacter sp. BT175]|uniref:hypothetical protein n=1 Tax=Hymenobacter translucens TaxID=2886507 RepID=UPI001D0DE8AE|nr:hypothetical protein [Hymenobacter translucens]MCC2545225.1 hypothetical protein [Hymenobacter translucens]